MNHVNMNHVSACLEANINVSAHDQYRDNNCQVSRLILSHGSNFNSHDDDDDGKCGFAYDDDYDHFSCLHSMIHSFHQNTCSPSQQQPTALPNGTVSSPTTGGAPSGTAVSLPLISRPNIVNSSAIQSSTPTTSTGSHIIRTTAATINMNTTMSSMAPGRQTVLLTQADGSKIPVMIQTSSSGQTSIVGNSQMGNVLVRPGTPGQQVLVSNPNVVPQMVLTTRPGGQPINLQQLQQQQLTLTPGQQQANRALAPRPGYIVQNGPVRFNPQGLRPGTSPAIVSQGLTLRPGMGPILIRTEQGLQLVNVGPATGGATSLPPGIRFQTPGIRPQTGMSINLGSPSVGPLRPGMQTVTMTQQGMQQQQSIGLAPTQPLTIQTSQANTQAASAAPSQMSPNTAKKKCKNFLSTLIKLANDQPEQVATNVRKLIQDLIVSISCHFHFNHIILFRTE